jgi:hypothetical protein
MMNFGPTELLFFFGFPLSGFLAALYLGLALRSNARRNQERR